MTEPDEVLVADADAWRRWLERNHGKPGVWLVLAKKGRTEPTRLGYDDALDEALCFGWIDTTVRRRDEATYLQRFAPRRARSAWTDGNAERVARLTRAGRMHEAGLAAVQRAREDGKWPSAR